MVPMPRPDRHVPFLTRVQIRDYKSIAKADVRLGAFTILVGRNGSGKSNFLDALRFVADSLRTSLAQAVQARGVVYEIKRRGAESPSFSIGLRLALPDLKTATYSLSIRALKGGAFSVGAETLAVRHGSGPVLGSYSVADGEILDCSIDNPPPVPSDRLYLVNVSGFPEFRAVHDALAAMSFYNFNPETLKVPQKPDAGDLLHRDGSNLASVVARLKAERPEELERIIQYLAAIVPGLSGIDRLPLGPLETLQFEQQIEGLTKPFGFFAWNMSDGTLRALSALAAAWQPGMSLVGIEEPESALHPAAAGALMDALREAASQTQILITSHSPDLLDHVDLETDRLLAVSFENGVTKIAPIDKASLSVIQDHLYTPGELLRLDQLEPDREDVSRQEEQLSRPLEDGDTQA